ncbi:NtaA/DmoA family FMN-dependent monooxygenase [Rhodococcus sp. 14C212]|uniref:NtaA/DmoA family FMN-dependent monooxygenase n=1 Tax=Rhodococcus sp. 14C212 TaxID=2711209 RepID=UPI0013EAB95F|nr:NtaA/DmoA family FMN-dependent monooxygenase [Rhodococcus sp. 14C212]NGP07390.1 NtaA/DmoA family FMN-dependent monooxygenase [Rhodococcus sp. 14C212]
MSSSERPRREHMVIGAFVSASITKTSLGAWMMPSTNPDVMSPNYYSSLAQTLDKSGFDFMFFDDRLAMPAAYEGSIRKTVERGARAIKLDPIPILGLLAGKTERLGLGGTFSTTYGQPYHVARSFATLDHMSGGRAIWNVVTSLNQDEAENFGVDYRQPGDRYDGADEFLEIVTALWESWGEDAVEFDRGTGRFADPDKIAPINYRGNRYSSKGPLTVPRSPQGWPALLQAGQSPRGRQFGARWADLIFMSAPTIDDGRKHYADQQQHFEAAGRGRYAAPLIPSAQVIVGDTEELARAKEAYYDSLVDTEEELIYVSEQANFDLSILPRDEPLTDDLIERVTGTRGLMANYIKQARRMFGENATLDDLARVRAARANNRFVGNPSQVADQMEEWFRSEACDGFVLQPTNSPGTYEDIARTVMPELRKRGLIGDPDTRGTIRQRLGLQDRTRG